MQAFLPRTGADQNLRGQPGRIINIFSIQGKYGTPFMAAYTASKHRVEGLSECIRQELMKCVAFVVSLLVSPTYIITIYFAPSESGAFLKCAKIQL